VVAAVPSSAVPESLQKAWVYLEMFFDTAPGIVIVAFIYNIWGFAANYWNTNYEETYDIKKLCATIAVFVGILSTAQALLPPEWATLITAIVIGLKYAISEFKKLSNGDEGRSL